MQSATKYGPRAVAANGDPVHMAIASADKASIEQKATQFLSHFIPSLAGENGKGEIPPHSVTELLHPKPYSGKATTQEIFTAVPRSLLPKTEGEMADPIESVMIKTAGSTVQFRVSAGNDKISTFTAPEGGEIVFTILKAMAISIVGATHAWIIGELRKLKHDMFNPKALMGRGPSPPMDKIMNAFGCMGCGDGLSNLALLIQKCNTASAEGIPGTITVMISPETWINSNRGRTIPVSIEEAPMRKLSGIKGSLPTRNNLEQLNVVTSIVIPAVEAAEGQLVADPLLVRRTIRWGLPMGFDTSASETNVYFRDAKTGILSSIVRADAISDRFFPNDMLVGTVVLRQTMPNAEFGVAAADPYVTESNELVTKWAAVPGLPNSIQRCINTYSHTGNGKGHLLNFQGIRPDDNDARTLILALFQTRMDQIRYLTARNRPLPIDLVLCVKRDVLLNSAVVSAKTMANAIGIHTVLMSENLARQSQDVNVIATGLNLTIGNAPSIGIFPGVSIAQVNAKPDISATGKFNSINRDDILEDAGWATFLPTTSIMPTYADMHTGLLGDPLIPLNLDDRPRGDLSPLEEALMNIFLIPRAVGSATATITELHGGNVGMWNDGLGTGRGVANIAPIPT